ncbi:hypothetical protein [Herbidospora daliensis]|nr:hypothetical protein [Herbidospora daliensis]
MSWPMREIVPVIPKYAGSRAIAWSSARSAPPRQSVMTVTPIATT